ncbi:MAG: DUF4430 domain-containing protein [Bacteroidales bacterium]|nr:DUF4430 domain-containing protein [Clostridium sp.]MCM1204019.1 DUF4430 domain-containing protein [Bacteroidales bacterium]
MNRNKWKKAAALAGILCLLVFTFWYGGDSENLRGFSLSEPGVETAERQSEETGLLEEPLEEASVEKTAQEQSVSDKENPPAEEKDDGGFFNRIVMNIKRKGKSSDEERQTQNNKKAQSNANQAVKKGSGEKNKSSNTKQPDNGSVEQEIGERKNAGVKSDTESGEQTAKDKKNYPQINFADTTADRTDGGNQNTAAEDTVTCTVDISCAVLLSRMDELKESKKKTVPADGVILEKTQVTIKAGSTVFDVLRNVAKARDIHLEYTYTPLYKSYYIEGINNLYQFDAGDLSGWMYSINGDFPGIGCSERKVSEGDEIRWLYTCSLGKDVGGYFEE